MDKKHTMAMYDNIIETLEAWMKEVAKRKDAGPIKGESGSFRGIHLVRLSVILGSLEDASTAMRRAYKDFSEFLTKTH